MSIGVRGALIETGYITSKFRHTGQACIMVCMRQINLNVTPEFDQDLSTYMRRKGIASKSEAIRQAVHEGAARSSPDLEFDYHSWIGIGLKTPLRERRRFRNEDELWS